jgi:hypothetical protein
MATVLFVCVDEVRATRDDIAQRVANLVAELESEPGASA